MTMNAFKTLGGSGTSPLDGIGAIIMANAIRIAINRTMADPINARTAITVTPADLFFSDTCWSLEFSKIGKRL